jgi:hypothetical protein
MKYGVYLAGANVPPISQFTDGAHIFAVWPTNQYHNQVVALEDSGWEVRDCLKAYLFGISYQIGLFRKPFKGTVANNVLENGCGGLNIDASRIGTIVQDTSKNGRGADKHKSTIYQSGLKKEFEGKITVGRFPANLVLDPATSELMDEQAPVAGNLFQAKRKKETSGGSGNSWTNGGKDVGENNGFYDSPSGASKFFAQVSNLTELKDLLTRLIEPPQQTEEREK